MRSHAPAYPVPFWIDRDDAPHVIRLVNMSDERVTNVRATLLGSGHLVPLEPLTLEPGRSARLTLIGVESTDSIVVVRWFRPDGEEYLWRISF
ncbi:MULTISPECIES: hypothetical protein [unclassified Frondihabitans]|uniref:hypothetical protein n=1 Tax=unclassified Frondihabitans TaxID=2626248 RepID=UPI000F4FB7C2|nr:MULTISPECIES: hypothetical protein [unclassified Frondihabitans]RPE76378.1 hypothetical protein EDF37_2200 [Frondihabitans sp. PhB153]RPF05346.1 hypothetical protein EDF39_2048 [Frondihabitans sp. PhB161]